MFHVNTSTHRLKRQSYFHKYWKIMNNQSLPHTE